MSLANELISQFAKTVRNETEEKREETVYGTAVEHNGSIYVKLDGSDLLTPIATTADMIPGERVAVMIKNHTATVTGNISSPSARTDDVKQNREDIAVLKLVVADKVSTKELEAEKGRIDELEADNVTINETLKANSAAIDTLATKKLDADTANITYATIKNLNSTNAKVENLEAVHGEFVDLTTEKFEATDAKIKNLNTVYANIDFSNIGKAAMEYFYATSGLIKNVTVGDQTITGNLVGVTISGDLIEGNTIVAEKLVIKGSDGLYYKLNTDGITTETEQTDYNSLNGSIIKAKSIAASKISVTDLVAFGATIGGFNITDSALYSGVKESIDNNTRGIYLDKDGQIAIGDSNNFLKFFRDEDGAYKLVISANSLKFSTSDKTVEEAVSAAIISSVEQFYLSDSPYALTGGSWSETQPTWTEGKYIWRRTLVTYGDGSGEYTPSAQGVCITGNTGARGDKGDDSILLMIESTNGNIFKNTGVATTLTVNIIVGSRSITCYRQLVEYFGESAFLQWSIKRLGETEYTDLPSDDSRLSDNGFILTLNPSDVEVKTVFNCSLNY